jgi:hypothetical protein
MDVRYTEEVLDKVGTHRRAASRSREPLLALLVSKWCLRQGKFQGKFGVSVSLSLVLSTRGPVAAACPHFFARGQCGCCIYGFFGCLLGARAHSAK